MAHLDLLLGFRRGERPLDVVSDCLGDSEVEVLERELIERQRAVVRILDLDRPGLDGPSRRTYRW